MEQHKANYKKLSFETPVYHPFYGEGEVDQIGIDYAVVVKFKDVNGNPYTRKFRYEMISKTEFNSIDELYLVPVKVATS